MEKKVYTVPKVGRGTEDDPIRPDLSGIEVPYSAIIQVRKDLGDKFEIEVIR
ncbi:MAG: hypothetical protein ACXQTR_03700 [Candidatus Methanospirareceae archaeon]